MELDKQMGGREEFEDVMLLALKMEEGATNQGVQVTSRSWKWQGSRFSPRDTE